MTEKRMRGRWVSLSTKSGNSGVVEQFFVNVSSEAIFVQYPGSAKGDVGVQVSIDELGKHGRTCLE